MNLIDEEGNAYKDVTGVFISKNPDTYGYDLWILLATRKEPIRIGYATPEKDILPQVEETIAQGIAHNARCIDLRDKFKPETEYFGWYGCTILKKERAKNT